MKAISYDVLVNNASTITVEDFVRSARTYLGTPYLTQGRTRRGMDCGGLLLAVGRDLDYSDLQVLGYSNSPDGETYEKLLAMTLNKLPEKFAVVPGDIIAVDYGEGTQHTAIVTELEPKIKVIHAKRAHGVIEQFLHGVDQRGWCASYRLRHL